MRDMSTERQKTQRSQSDGASKVQKIASTIGSMLRGSQSSKEKDTAHADEKKEKPTEVESSTTAQTQETQGTKSVKTRFTVAEGLGRMELIRNSAYQSCQEMKNLLETVQTNLHGNSRDVVKEGVKGALELAENLLKKMEDLATENRLLKKELGKMAETHANSKERVKPTIPRQTHRTTKVWPWKRARQRQNRRPTKRDRLRNLR